ncbi:MAG: DNA starvation/stationary phase protection protein Dps [Planctomycetes bacterium]|nr:DNA starvation/stationary phase protection protein Dps [Planctomycetota bacterium]
MKPSPSQLPPETRQRICDALLPVLIDGIDLFSQIKVAHWNIKGPQFAALHPLFDQFATDLQTQNDGLAERILTLGSLAVGTARHVARHSRLPDYPQHVTRDLEHVKLLAERIGAYLAGVRAARAVAVEQGDDDTVDVLTGIVTMFEKHAWFLHATLAD